MRSVQSAATLFAQNQIMLARVITSLLRSSSPACSPTQRAEALHEEMEPGKVPPNGRGLHRYTHRIKIRERGQG